MGTHNSIELNSSSEQPDATFSNTGRTVFSMVEIRKIRPKAQFLKVCGHFLISCYEKSCHGMLFYFFNVCCLWWNGNTSRRSLCWQVTDSGSWSWQPAPPFWSAAELPPLDHIQSLPSPGCSRGEVCSRCSKKPALLSVVCCFCYADFWFSGEENLRPALDQKPVRWCQRFLFSLTCPSVSLYTLV